MKLKKAKTPLCDWCGQHDGTILLAFANSETKKIVDATVCASGLGRISAACKEHERNMVWLHSEGKAFIFDMWEAYV